MKLRLSTAAGLALALAAAAPAPAQSPSPFEGLDIRTKIPAAAASDSDISFFPPFEGYDYSKTKIAGVATEFRVPNKQPLLLGFEVFPATVEFEGEWVVFIALERNEEDIKLGKRANLRITCADFNGKTFFTRADNAKRRQYDVDGVKTPGLFFQFPFVEYIVPFGGQCWWELTFRRGEGPIGDYLIDFRLYNPPGDPPEAARSNR